MANMTDYYADQGFDLGGLALADAVSSTQDVPGSPPGSTGGPLGLNPMTTPFIDLLTGVPPAATGD
jgi:hypothetical protein